MRTALRNSTVLSPRARLVLETLMVLMSLAAVTGELYATQQHAFVNVCECHEHEKVLHLMLLYTYLWNYYGIRSNNLWKKNILKENVFL